MHTITIHADSRDSRILVGESIGNLPRYLPPGKTIIITDENLLKIYGSVFPPVPVIAIGLGEQNKTLETLNFIFDKLLMYEADRSTFILAIGGGIVCDVAGFAASIYMRGLRYGFVSTTLLSQVDASVGGKNGVNFRKYKNILGVFNQPEFVIVDTSLLKTQDEKEYISGFAEVIKAAAIQDESLFNFLEINYEAALRKEDKVLEKIIFDSIRIKSRVVENDEKEKGERRILNFGHTFAHAIEHKTGMLHGEAVSIGMALASALSVKMGLLKKAHQERLLRLLQNMQLPVSMNNLDEKLLLDAMKVDKKREGENLHMVFLDRIGHAIVETVSLNQLEKILI